MSASVCLCALMLFRSGISCDSPGKRRSMCVFFLSIVLKWEIPGKSSSMPVFFLYVVFHVCLFLSLDNVGFVIELWGKRRPLVNFGT